MQWMKVISKPLTKKQVESLLQEGDSITDIFSATYTIGHDFVDIETCDIGKSFNDISDTETYSNCIFYLDWAIDYIESVISVLEEEVSLEEYYEE